MSNQVFQLHRWQFAMISGISLLIMAVIAPIALFGILERLIVPEDALQTFENITQAVGSFRWSISLFLFVVILDILVAWGFFYFFKPINHQLSLLAAWLRLGYAAILAAAVMYLVKAAQIAARFGTADAQVDYADQALAAIETFQLSWQFGLVIFGFHLLVIGVLAFSAGYLKKILGVLLLVAGLGYIIDGFGYLLTPDYSLELALFTFIGEVVMIFWLFAYGIQLRKEAV